jgi:hypothetical protein
MHIVGSIPELGAWIAEEGLLMQWTKGDIWVRACFIFIFYECLFFMV